MKYLETILAFLTQLARIIFPRKQKPAAGDCPCPDPMPAPPEPSLPSDAGDRSDPDLYRGDTLALVHPSPGPLNLRQTPRRTHRDCRLQPDGFRSDRESL